MPRNHNKQVKYRKLNGYFLLMTGFGSVMNQNWMFFTDNCCHDLDPRPPILALNTQHRYYKVMRQPAACHCLKGRESFCNNRCDQYDLPNTKQQNLMPPDH